MAKRKLSLEQRQSVRQDVRQLVSQKKRQAEILRAVAKKYGITPVTARWYYNSIVRAVKPASARKAKRSRRALAYRPPPPAGGTALRIVHQVQSIAEKNLRRVLEVKRLIPKWQSYVKKEAALRKLESKVKSDLRSISTKASALHRKIRALNSR
jgi:hypothetical protein